MVESGNMAGTGKASYHRYGSKTMITISIKVCTDTSFPFKEDEPLVAEINGKNLIISKVKEGQLQSHLTDREDRKSRGEK